MSADDIRRHAEYAWRCGLAPNDACFLPFGSRDGLHWYACYWCAGLHFTVT